MRYTDGVPAEIGDLNPEPGLNRPYETDPFIGSEGVAYSHTRALAAFIAQLHARVQELEKLVSANVGQRT